MFWFDVIKETKMQTIKNDTIKSAFELCRKQKQIFDIPSILIWIAKREGSVLCAINDGLKPLVSIN